MAGLATILCLSLIVYLFRKDLKNTADLSNGLWIPLVWIFLAASRWASSWLNLSVPMASADAYSEGSPVDRAVFFSLIVAGVIVLSKRKIDWNLLMAKNSLLIIYFLYCLMSIAWTDEPFVLFKRWIKDLGNPIMALVILTEQRPYDAVGAVLRRLAFLLIPLSVLFIRYYPELGRGYHADGSPMYTGVGHQKNDLGGMCLVSGLYFAWEFIQNRKQGLGLETINIWFYYAFILMIAWLLRMSNSQTSLFCLVVAIFLFLVVHIGFLAKKPSRMLVYGILGSLLLYLLDVAFHVKDLVFEMLGRDSSLTNRTELWAVLRSLEVNSIIGAGFMSFWTGGRMDIVAEKMGAIVNQAHSGYLEQYLNLGYIGVGFIALIILSGMVKLKAHLDIDSPPAMLRLSIVVTALFINYTEACFYGINTYWLLLLLAVIDISGQKNAEPIKNNRGKGQTATATPVKTYRYKKPAVAGRQNERILVH